MSKADKINRFEFKAWDTVNKKMLDFSEFTLKGTEEHGWLPCDLEGKLMVTKKEPDTIKILQFTGRKDRIGQKIFEGHLLKGDYGDIYEVVYDVDTTSFKLEPTEGASPIDWSESSKMVFVGNIYEGSYLLEDN